MISVSFSLLSTILYSFGLSFFDTIYLSMFLPSLFLIILQKHALFAVLKKLLFLNIFIVIVSLSAYFDSKYQLALLIFLRSNALLLFVLLLFWNKNLFDIAQAMQKLRAPDKLIALFFFIAKFVIIIKEEFKTTKKVMNIRGFKPKSNVFTYKTYANTIGMLIVKCFERADKLKNVMILRGFSGKIYQSHNETFTLIDICIFVLTLLSLFLKIGEISV